MASEKPSKSLSRRTFMNRMAGGAAAVSFYPVVSTKPSPESFVHRSSELIDERHADEEYWELVKEQFTIKPGLIVLNAANLCPSPHTVRERLFELSDDLNRDVSFQNRSKFGGLQEAARSKIAAYMGASADEVAIVRNTSEANNIIVSGLELATGDEVVIFNENHPTLDTSWEVGADRYGYTVKRFAIPSPPESKEDMLRIIEGALSATTKVLAFSEVSNTSGIRIPAKEVCSLARQRGIYTHIDGAQTFGALAVDVHDMGCESYAASAHKWFVGPKEAGILYIRADKISSVWPINVGVGWSSEVEPPEGARKFETLGQRDDAAIAAFGTTADYLNLIGREKIEARVLELASMLKKGLAEIPGVTLRTSQQSELSAGVCISALDGVESFDVFQRLYEHHGVVGAPTGGLRLCPHIYTTKRDIEMAIDAVRKEMAG